jgi:glycosyltransferase involved in cell wall biosynthesis
MEAHNPLESATGAPELTINLNDGSNEQVSIIVIHHKKPEYLNICLQSIHVCSHLNNYEVIVVDNNSDDQETSDYLDVLQDEGMKVIRNTTNKYWSAACNQAVAAADPHSNYFIFLHADTVVLDPAWIDVLVNISASKGAGIVGMELGEYYIQKQRAQFIQEWCMLMSRQCWNDCGPWPEDLPLVGMSFIMTLRAQVKGHKPQSSGNKLIHHYKSFSIDPSEFEKICEKGLATLPKMMQQVKA